MNQVALLRMYMHCGSRDIDRMSIHEGAIHIEHGVRAKDKWEMLFMQLQGVKVEEIEYYQKYFGGSYEEPDIDEEIKHAEQINQVLAGLKKKHGK